MLAFVIECLRPGRRKLGFLIVLLYAMPFVSCTHLLEKDIITIAPGVTEIVFPASFDYTAWATFVPLSLFASTFFLLYFFRTKARKSISMVILFITVAICSGLLDWPGFLPQYLTLERGFLVLSLLFFVFQNSNLYIRHYSYL
jgi:hypothetical protein